MPQTYHKSALKQAPLAEAKRILPLPQLMERIGDGKHAKKSAFCPFHENTRTEAFSVYKTPDGAWLWKCHAACGRGDGVDYLEKRFSLSTKDAIARYCSLAGLTSATKAAANGAEPFDWQKRVSALTADARRKLADWRGLSPGFVDWLCREKILGSYKGFTALAVHTAAREVAACHYRKADGSWRYFPKGAGTHPLVFGNPANAVYVLCFESQWDAFAVMDKFSWHTGPPDDYAVFISRGAENGELIKGQCLHDAVVYAFVQNDTAKPDGTTPAEKWLSDVARFAGCKVLRVTTPAPHKDANDWTRAGATLPDIEGAIRAAKAVPIAETAGQTALQPGATDFESVTSWLRGKIISILTDKNATAAQQRAGISNLAVEAVCRVGSLFFHAALRDYDSALFFNAHTKRLERLRGDSFTAWLSDWLQINRADSLFRFAIAAIETAALSGPRTTGILPESFWAARPGALYLSNGDGSAAKMTTTGVDNVDNGTDGVLFAAGRTCAPWKLTEAKDIFQTCAIFRSLHTTAGHAPDLLRAWIYSLPTNPPCKPPLCLAGDVGSGKTRLAKAIAEFYGVPFVAAKVEESEESNFWPCCDAGGIYILDNADTKCRWLADAVANAATDGCSERRKLYTNRDMVILRARAWLCVTTANPTFAADSGLADRLLVLRMARREEQTSYAALTAEILANRDAGLSHLAATLQKALGDTGPTPAGLNARHPDWAAFAVKIGRALGREAAAVTALRAAEADKAAFCLENDAIGTALLSYLREAEEFNGTAAELAPKLIAIDKDLDGHLSAKRLGRRLGALWPHLQKSLAVTRKEINRDGVTLFTFQAKGAGFAGFQAPFS